MASPNVDLVALAIPAFLALIGVEMLVARVRGRSVIRFNDATADISCGVSNQLFELGWKSIFFILYAWCFSHRLIDWGDRTGVVVVLALVGVDFCYYWWHRSSHGSNLMWAAHVVHHQSEDYNLAVALRQAWFTGLTSMPFYLPLALLGVPPWAYALGMGVNLLYQFWIHTELIDRIGPLEWIFNSPSHHRVHHGVNDEYLDRNHGGILIVWDRVFGTFEPEVAPPTYGTTTALASFDPLWANLSHLEFTRKLCAAAPTLRESVWAWFAHPAWRPAGWSWPEPPTDLEREPYDPPHSVAVKRFVLAQQALVFPAVFFVLSFSAHLQGGDCLCAGATIVGITAGWAALLEGRRDAITFVRTMCVPWTGLVGLGLPWLLTHFVGVPADAAWWIAWGLGAATAVGYAWWAGRLSRA